MSSGAHGYSATHGHVSGHTARRAASPRALDRVGERWALLVVRELMLGPKRFTDLRRGLSRTRAPTCSPSACASSSRRAWCASARLPPPAASQVYELTDWGAELEPVLVALGRWGARAPLDPRVHGHERGLPRRLAARRCSTRRCAGDFEASPRAADGRGRLPRRRSPAARSTPAAARRPSPDAVLTLDPGTLIALIHGEISVADALASGALALEGDRAGVERFVGLFPLPEPAAVPA